MNIWDILILCAVGAAVAVAVRTLRGKGKQGGCSCGCGGCTKECASRRDPDQMAGKNEYNITVNFPGDESLVGEFVPVRILSAGESTLRGVRAEKEQG